MEIQRAEQEFIGWLKTSRDLSHNTLRAYRGDLKAFSLHVGLHSSVNELSAGDLVNFLEEQRNSGLSPASIRRRMAALRRFCRWLLENDVVAKDPWSEVSVRVRKPRALPRPVHSEDLTRLLTFLTEAAGLRTTTPPRSGPLRAHQATTLVAVTLMLATGLRVGEVAGVRCCDLDIADSSIRVRGKGSKERTVFLPDPWTQHLVTAYVEVREGLAIEHQHLLFSRSHGPMTPATIRTRLREAAARARTKHPITPHMLRHSAATNLIESGVDIRYVQRLLGHATLSTTEIYTHVSDVALRRVVSEANVVSRCMTRR